MQTKPAKRHRHPHSLEPIRRVKLEPSFLSRLWCFSPCEKRGFLEPCKRGSNQHDLVLCFRHLCFMCVVCWPVSKHSTLSFSSGQWGSSSIVVFSCWSKSGEVRETIFEQQVSKEVVGETNINHDGLLGHRDRGFYFRFARTPIHAS